MLPLCRCAAISPKGTTLAAAASFVYTLDKVFDRRLGRPLGGDGRRPAEVKSYKSHTITWQAPSPRVRRSLSPGSSAATLFTGLPFFMAMA